MDNNGLIDQNPASALHASSADLLQCPLPTKFSITVATVCQGITDSLTAEQPGQGCC